MRVSLSALQKIVNQAVDVEQLNESFRNEVNRVLGPAVIAEGKAEQVAEVANERIDVLERTGRASRLSFNSSVTCKLIEHSSPEVRKFAARVVPEKFLLKMSADKNHAVRSAVARRLPLNSVSEMLKRFPKDDALHLIYKARKINEAGIPQPKTVDEPFDMYGEERLGDAVKQDDGSELSETWYNSLAQNLVQDYGRTMDTGWQYAAVRRYCASTKATNNTNIDEVKLLEAVNEILEKIEDDAVERFSLKETLSYLNKRIQRESSSKPVMPIIDLKVDPVRNLLENKQSPQTFIDSVNALFQIKTRLVPKFVQERMLAEGSTKKYTIPASGRLPHDDCFRAVDERVLDMYCAAWNDKKSLQQDSIRLNWTSHASEPNRFLFNVTLK